MHLWWFWDGLYTIALPTLLIDDNIPIPPWTPRVLRAELLQIATPQFFSGPASLVSLILEPDFPCEASLKNPISSDVTVTFKSQNEHITIFDNTTQSCLLRGRDVLKCNSGGVFWYRVSMLICWYRQRFMPLENLWFLTIQFSVYPVLTHTYYSTSAYASGDPNSSSYSCMFIHGGKFVRNDSWLVVHPNLCWVPR